MTKEMKAEQCKRFAIDAKYYKEQYEKVYKQLQEVLSDLCDGDCGDCKYKQICENREW